MHTATRLFCVFHSLLVLVYCRFFSFVFQIFSTCSIFSHLSQFCFVSLLRMFPCYFGQSNETTLPLGLSFGPIFRFFQIWAWRTMAVSFWDVMAYCFAYAFIVVFSRAQKVFSLLPRAFGMLWLIVLHMLLLLFKAEPKRFSCFCCELICISWLVVLHMLLLLL